MQAGQDLRLQVRGAPQDRQAAQALPQVWQDKPPANFSSRFEISNPLPTLLLCTLFELCVLVLASKVLNPTCLDFSTSTSPG